MIVKKLKEIFLSFSLLICIFSYYTVFHKLILTFLFKLSTSLESYITRKENIHCKIIDSCYEKSESDFSNIKL